ncbi:MAG: hypothetical protein IPK50_15050 [Fibrobacterota bacterium]|nr:hypothetical protein [Fibrobacterota bacterium]QQS03610.1 MAG: hypothetical protein IPK50_15050 [Fibrobacterota bacterium]
MNIQTTLPVMDFESITGDAVPGTLVSSNPLSFTNFPSINRSNPISGKASARLFGVLNGGNYTAYSSSFFSWDLAFNNKFALDASGARGIRMVMRCNKTHFVEFTPSSWLYSKQQNDSGALMNWRFQVGNRLDTLDFLFEEMGYRSWLFDRGRPCQVDSATYCNHPLGEILTHLSGFTLNLSGDYKAVPNDTVILDIDDVHLIY